MAEQVERRSGPRVAPGVDDVSVTTPTPVNGGGDEDGLVVPFATPLGRAGRLLGAVDASIGAGAVVVVALTRAASLARPLVDPLVGVVMRPPLLDRRFTPESVLHRLAVRGSAIRVGAGAELDAASRELVPAVVDAVVERIDLTDIVIERVDLDRVVANVDLDRAVERVDLDRAVARVDLVGIANYLVDAIDLPDIIRVSTGSVATEAVRGVRMQSIDADAQLQRVVDRMLLRRRGRRTQAPVPPEASAGSNGRDPE